MRGGEGAGIEAARLEPYAGPKARIAVAKFEDKTAKGEGVIGEGMATMFTTALVNSNRYIVLERDLLDEVIREQDLGAQGRVRPGTEAPVGEIEGAELLVLGAVTEFEPERMGIGGGLLGVGTLVGTALLHSQNRNIPVAAATYTESHVAIDLRVVDAATSRLLFTVGVEGKGYDWGGGILAEVGGGRARLPVAFGGFQKTSMEQAVRTAIDVGVAELARRTPREFFRHRDEAFSSGRMLALAYLDLPGLTGERFPERGVRTADTPAEWAALAGELGLAGGGAPPVDFSSQRVAALFGGRQDAPWRTVSVERAVAHPDRVELTVAVLPAPEATGGAKPTAGAWAPMALVRIEKAPGPVQVSWSVK